MSTTREPERLAPRTVRVRGRRLTAATLTLVSLPMTLAACGLLGGQTNHGEAPVEISNGAVDPGQADPTPPSTPGGGSPSPTDTPPADTQSAVDPNAPPQGATSTTTQVVVSAGKTVTRTGIVTRTQINTETMTQVRTQVKILTPRAVTNTQTQTQTQTQTETQTQTQTKTETKTMQVPGPTVTVTVKCVTNAAGATICN